MLLLASGCRHAKSSPKSGGASTPASNFLQGARTDSPGHSEEYMEGPPRRLAYEINWKSGNVIAAGSQHFDLALQGVSGRFFKKGQPVALFDADTGTAIHATGLLTLQGHVHIRSIDPKSPIKGLVLTCDTVTYRTTEEIIKAKGNILVDGPSMHGSGIDELWCTNDLAQIATPDLYVPVRHNLPSSTQHK